MKHSTINVKIKNFIKRFIVIIFWLLVWQIASLIISEEILLASPLSVIKTLFKLIVTKTFWLSILYSFSKIISGFIIAIITGSMLACFSYKFNIIKELINPLMILIKSIPVASFVILALVWIGSKNLSIFTSFLMVLPIIYTNILEGFNNTDYKLLEMSYIFNVTPLKKLLYIYIPQIMPFFISACSLSLGLCWKSGIAAEVIGLPKNSIGEKLYNAKIFLDIDELFAWTFVIIIISIVFEKIILNLINYFYRVERE